MTELNKESFLLIGCYANDGMSVRQPHWGVAVLENDSVNRDRWGILLATAGKGRLVDAVKTAVEYPEWTNMNAIICMSQPLFTMEGLEEERAIALKSEMIKQFIAVSFIQNENPAIGHALYAAGAAATTAFNTHDWVKELQAAGRAAQLTT